ncbi:ABC transporter ATP-binding protein [Devosia rhodophyticola]|uniref:ABC transporter ATP-binding protein n=1 Tax=Devosia rhodophyticola TaxID=3026423 RepID=A0ABY7Z1J4_9HYPH|nr:ABC transporter ATP-binding protein [Devosia rhodophyticola]WDR07553.1 ABC transporter ATP-binding protein [Devosia rhodophyticola]
MPLTPMHTDSPEPLLRIRGLKTHFFTADGVVKAVDGVDLDVQQSRTTCILGESGCGKSIMARSILRIVDAPGRIVDGSIIYRAADGRTVDLAAMSPTSKAIREIRGSDISMIFQEPMSSLGPIQKIGKQISETILLHRKMSKAEAKEAAIEMLDRVGIPNPAKRYESYPFELSGGMRQRAMIAMALSCQPRMLIADEPTTALDVTTQAQILDLIADLKEEFDMSVMLITHDLGVVAEVAEDVAVMYMGKVVERGDVYSVFENPKHPYTQALLESVPRIGGVRKARLPAIKGMVPHPLARPSGCSFRTRCERYMPGICDKTEPVLTQEGSSEVACFLYSSELANVR